MVAEASNSQTTLTSRGFDTATLEAEITKCLSTLLSEKPGEAAIASELLRVCLCDKLANAQADHFLHKRYAEIPATTTDRGLGAGSKADGVANSTISPLPQMAPRINPAVATYLSNALSTLIIQQPSAAVPEILRLQAALREHEQIPVITIDVPEATSPQVSPSFEKPEPTVAAQVQHLFKPFTRSAAMKVRIEGHPEPVFLKLFDRRFASTLRSDNKVPAWTEALEANYHDLIHSGGVIENLINYNNNNNEDEIQDSSEYEKAWEVGDNEAALQDKSHDLYQTEVAAYYALSPLQGVCIPKLLATVRLQPYPDADPEIQKHTAVHGLLLSYIPGFTLDKFGCRVPGYQWQGVCDAAVRAVNACCELGVLNEDVRPRNCIVRCVTKTGTVPGEEQIIYRPFIIDFDMVRLRRLDENDEEWKDAKIDVDQEGGISCLIFDLEMQYGRGDHIYWNPDYWRVKDEVLAGSDHTEGEEADVWDEGMEVLMDIIFPFSHRSLMPRG